MWSPIPMCFRPAIVPAVLTVMAAALVVVACQAPNPSVQRESVRDTSVDKPVAGAPREAATTPTAAATPTPAPENVARFGTVTASAGQESAGNAVDGDVDTVWSANGPAPQSLTLTLDKPYLASRIELVVTQLPAGQTTHEIWLAGQSGNLALYQRLTNTYTADGDTLVVPIDPPVVVTGVMIQTLDSPSFVAWREVRVFGQTPPADAADQQLAGPPRQREIVWPRVQLSGGFDLPVQVTHAGDGSGRLFVVEQRGRVRIVENGALLSRPFLAIEDRVSCCGERGLLNIAFPPGYAEKGHFYISYTATNGDLVVARYRVTADPNVADPLSEEVLLTIPQPTEVHNGGRLVFGPKDGYLYVGSGDGGVPVDGDNRAQDLQSLLGKILRIDVEAGVFPYRIPDDNPFVHTPGARGEIWALGLRNPWGLTFDPETGDLYIADVGERSYEEVNYQPASSSGGENYGWPILEGLHCTGVASCDASQTTLPVAQYSHEHGCSIIGGPIARGQPPHEYRLFLYADFCSGRLWGLQRVDDRWHTNLLSQAPFLVSALGEDENGRVYVADYTHGSLLQLVDASRGERLDDPEDPDREG
ncbi:MAG TPA: PQQ-dependent sugar dehydrogenase [Chloroflexota bacterium]